MLARPDTVGYQMRRFAHRYRAWLAAAAIALVSLLAGALAVRLSSSPDSATSSAYRV